MLFGILVAALVVMSIVTLVLALIVPHDPWPDLKVKRVRRSTTHAARAGRRAAK